MSKEYLKEPGIYEALIINTEAKTSSKGDPMLVVTFKQIGGTGGEINAYYVITKKPNHKFMTELLASLKLACGLPPIVKKEDFLGKKVRITVELQKVKPGQERINEKNGLPYPPSSQVVAYAPIQSETSIPNDHAFPF